MGTINHDQSWSSKFSIMINHGKLFPLFTGENGGILPNKPPGIPPFFPVNKGQPGTAQLKLSWSSQISWEINIWNHQAATTTVVTVIYSQEKLQTQESGTFQKHPKKQAGSVQTTWMTPHRASIIGNKWQTSGFGVLYFQRAKMWRFGICIGLGSSILTFDPQPIQRHKQELKQWDGCTKHAAAHIGCGWLWHVWNGNQLRLHRIWAPTLVLNGFVSRSSEWNAQLSGPSSQNQPSRTLINWLTSFNTQEVSNSSDSSMSAGPPTSAKTCRIFTTKMFTSPDAEDIPSSPEMGHLLFRAGFFACRVRCRVWTGWYFSSPSWYMGIEHANHVRTYLELKWIEFLTWSIYIYIYINMR